MRWLIAIILVALAMMIIGSIAGNVDLQVCGFLAFFSTGVVAIFRWMVETE